MKGKHTSLDKHLKANVKWLESQPGVKKVILGFCESCRHKYAPGQIRFKMEVPGGIKINAYSGSGVIDVFVRIHPISFKESIKLNLINKMS